MKYRIKQLGEKLINKVPTLMFQKKIKLTELLGDLCLIRSELNIEIQEYSNNVEKLSIIYNSIVHALPIDQDSIEVLNRFQQKILSTSERINLLLIMNSNLSNKVIKLNEKEYFNNPDIEKGISISIDKAKRINNKFEVLSKKISNLDPKETP